MEAPGNGRTPITTLIAVSVRMYREGLAATLGAQAHLRIQATAGTLLETQAAVRSFQPDVVIVDVSLDDALQLMRLVRAENSRSRILAFAVREDITTILHYASAGADGFVTANGSVADLIEAIERAAAGELLCSPRIAAQLLRRASQQTTQSAAGADAATLTRREHQVFCLLRRGQSNKEIAISLNIREATVKNHVHHVLGKLQVATRGQAAAAGAAAPSPSR